MTEQEQQPAGQDADLDPPLSVTGVPQEVIRNRETQAARNAVERTRIEPRIDAHIHAHRLALDHLANVHQWIADTYDFDVVGDTRPAALWQMSGRCIGIGRLILDALQLGYTSEVLHLGRALHEADGLLEAFYMQNEDTLVRRWIAGEYVRPAEVRQAQARYDALLAEPMRGMGATDDPIQRNDTRRKMFD